MIKETQVKIICTIGPASLEPDILKKLEARKVFLARINLSHVRLEDIETYIHKLLPFNIPIAIDTEGCQIRTGYIEQGSVFFHNNSLVRVYRSKVPIDGNQIYFNPHNVVDFFKPGDLIELDFNSVLLRVEDVSILAKDDFILCRVIIEGSIGSSKGVHSDSMAQVLPAFSQKDLKAFDLAKKYGIKHFTLSFMNTDLDVKNFKEICPQSVAYAKIETLSGVKNVEAIMKHVEGILIDRGDLSRDVPIERIPLMQKYLIEKANAAGKEVLVASNLIETMALALKPSRAEANDIISTIRDGVSGFVLTKETAVGQYPVETVNMLESLIKLGKHARQMAQHRDTNDIDYLLDRDTDGLLIEPHGGRLIERLWDPKALGQISSLPKLLVNEDILMDLDQISVGAFSPLEGFLVQDDYKSVLERMRLANGVPWPIPVILPVDDNQKKGLAKGEEIALCLETDGAVYGTLKIEEIYPFDKEEFARRVYGTMDDKHPGVQILKKCGEYLLGGKVKLIKRPHFKFDHLNLTPRQARRIFESLGWSKVVGFHTRNVIHRSHEYIQLEAMERCGCDGLFVHPVAGRKKAGDYTVEAIVQSYQIMVEKYYPKNRVIFGMFSTYSRYAGFREAVFTALCRKNFGCSHFIVGRDHTGVGQFYGATSSQDIFHQFEDIVIEPVFFDEVGFSSKLKKYMHKKDAPEGDFLNISGTKAREMFKNKNSPPDWFMRQDISDAIINQLSNGQKVFVE
ncbi:MAG: sulfate adenylyltransferase [Candidatus Omnitrophica bacterium]|nr:sulfate adenylyltransferase [Candidatus Omnitrophota bacterium]